MTGLECVLWPARVRVHVGPWWFWLALSICGATLSSVTVRAAPVNDAYADATALPSSLPAEALGTNIGATTEAGEALVPPSGATVWWSWTPNVEGWVKLTVQGGALDPVASLFMGQSADLSARLAWNDDAVAGSGTSSELIVPIDVGQVYHIQVAGYAGSEGAVSLKSESTAAPPQVSALTFAPAGVDVTTHGGAAQFAVGITHAAGFASGRLALFRPDGVEESFAPVDARFRTSGTAEAGSYQVTLPVRPGVVPGTYRLQLEVEGSDGAFTVYGERTPFPGGVAASLPVVNNGVVDDDFPAITSLTVSPAIADVTAEGTTASFTVRVADPISGISDFACLLELRSPSGSEFGGEGFLLGGHPLSFRNRIAGDNFDGTYLVEIPIPAGSPPGNYPLALDLEDRLGNRVSYGPASEEGEVALPAALPAHLTVVNNGTVDTQAPVLTSLAVNPASVNVAEFQAVTLTVGASDARSGVASVALSGAAYGLQPVGGGAVVEVSMNLEFISGTSASGSYRGITILPPGMVAGSYRVVGLVLVDALGNGVAYGPPELNLTPFPAGVDPLVTIRNDPVPGPYRTWLAGHPTLTGLDASRTADPDGDGLSNLVELALGTNPLVANVAGSADPNQSHAPTYQRVGNELRMRYIVATDNLGTGPRRISVFPQESTDLSTWDGAIVIIDGSETTTAFIRITNGQRKWLRLMVYDPALDLGG